MTRSGRRNLSPDAAAILRGKLYNARKQSREANLKQNKPKGQNDLSENTAENIAKQTGVSEKTVRRNASFAKASEEQGVEAEVVAGKVKRRDVMKPKREKAKAAKVPRHRREKWKGC